MKTSDAEWQRRESTCTDRDCLEQWYAERRAELKEEAQREPAPPAEPEEPPAQAEGSATSAGDG